MSDFVNIKPPGICRHCKETRRIHRRGLCYTCYHDKEIRNRYPRKQFDNNSSGWIASKALTTPAEPTNAFPGTDEKKEVMRQRFERNEHLFHPEDVAFKRPKGGRSRGQSGLVDHHKKGRLNNG